MTLTFAHSIEAGVRRAFQTTALGLARTAVLNVDAIADAFRGAGAAGVGDALVGRARRGAVEAWDDDGIAHTGGIALADHLRLALLFRRNASGDRTASRGQCARCAVLRVCAFAREERQIVSVCWIVCLHSTEASTNRFRDTYLRRTRR